MSALGVTATNHDAYTQSLILTGKDQPQQCTPVLEVREWWQEEQTFKIILGYMRFCPTKEREHPDTWAANEVWEHYTECSTQDKGGTALLTWGAFYPSASHYHNRYPRQSTYKEMGLIWAHSFSPRSVCCLGLFWQWGFLAWQSLTWLWLA